MRCAFPLVLAALLVVGAGGCGNDDDSAGSSVAGVEAGAGLSVEIVAEGLDRPTQIARAADGALYVAQLAGGERDGTGQVLRLDPAAPDVRTVVADGLLVPTGVAVVDGELWVMEQRRLTRGSIGGGDRVVVRDDLPFNGRSNGTLTVLADSSVLYNTSGRSAGATVVEGSGRLWTVRPGGEPAELASGLKHAYAHIVDPDGTLWTTEIGDGSYDGRAPVDELVAVVPGANHGWPLCVGDNRPVAEYGADPTTCAAVPSSHATFAAGATPTSVAVAPWDDDRLVVALWNSGRVVAVPRSTPGGEPEVLLTGVERPQHLLADGDRLLLVDHGGGRILALSR